MKMIRNAGDSEWVTSYYLHHKKKKKNHITYMVGAGSSYQLPANLR
jgi:hypothetical protein